MSDVDVAAVRARLEAATPGPWRFIPSTDWTKPNLPRGVYPETPNEYSHSGEQSSEDCGGFAHATGTVCWFGNAESYYNTCGEAPNDADAALIAHAPTDIAALLAALDQQQRRIDALEDLREFGTGGRRALEEQCDQQQREIERLTGELDAANQHVRIVNARTDEWSAERDSLRADLAAAKDAQAQAEQENTALRRVVDDFGQRIRAEADRAKANYARAKQAEQERDRLRAIAREFIEDGFIVPDTELQALVRETKEQP